MQLPAGLYVCKVMQANETKTSTEKPQIVILFDVAEGEYKDFYKAQYEAARRMDAKSAKWKGVHKQIMDGSSLPFFKGLMTSIERSNQGYIFPWGVEGNEKTLVGKKFGAVMGREQFETRDGGKAFATKIFQVRSVDGLKDAKIPEDRLLPESGVPTGYAPAAANNPASAHPNGFMDIPDGTAEELPFM